VTQDAYAINQIKEPSLAVQLAAIQGNYYTLKLIKHPHPKLLQRYEEWKAKLPKGKKETQPTEEIEE
jgi:hypothetical protein